MPNRRGTVIPTTLAAALFAFVIAGWGCENKITDSDIRFVRVSELRDLTARQARSPDSRIVALIDPRSGSRFEAGHIPGARNLKLPQVPERSTPDPELAAFRHLIVYGENPASAAARAMTKRMMAVGYKGVRLFAGGLEEWAAAGYPVEGQPQAAPEPEAGPDQPEAATPSGTPN